MKGYALYGDMDAFVRKLKDMGYEDVRLIDTTDGTFLKRKEAVLFGLVSSKLLIGGKNKEITRVWHPRRTGDDVPGTLLQRSDPVP